jgi:hypothetical protein
MTTTMRRMVLGAILLIASAFVATGLAGSAALNADHTYHACFQSNGNVYLTGESGLNAGCRNNDTAFTFNMQGQVGPVGAQGPQGIQGPVGPQGLQGPPGPQGIQGLTGVAGANGKDGADGAPGKDGTNGTDGTNGVSVVASVLPSGDAHCTTGGVQLSVGTSNTFVCNGARGPEGPQGPAGSSSSVPAADSYAGNYVLTIDGSIVGGVHLIDGCALAAPVVTATINGVSAKHLGSPTYEPCTFEFGANATSELWGWFGAAFSGNPVRHSIEFIRTGSSHLDPEISCQDALMTELSVPDLSPGSSSAFLLTAQVTPEQCTSSTSGAPLVNTQVTPFASSDVSVSLSNVTGGPSSLDGFTFSQPFVAGVGSGIQPIEPGPVHIPNLTLHYPASDTASVAALKDWFHSYAVEGNTAASNEFPVTVSLGAKVFAFTPAGISRLDPEERASDNAYRADVFSDGVAISG